MARIFKYFKFALKINPDLSHAHYGIAKIYQKMRDYKMAIEHFTHCVEFDPENFKAFFQLGVINLDMGSYSKAKEMLEKSSAKCLSSH